MVPRERDAPYARQAPQACATRQRCSARKFRWSFVECCYGGGQEERGFASPKPAGAAAAAAWEVERSDTCYGRKASRTVSLIHIALAGAQQSAMQTLDAATAAALERGETVRVRYASGFTHRARLEPPWPPMPTIMLHHAWADLARRPRDMYVEATVIAVQAMLQGLAKQHGRFEVYSFPDR